MTNPMESPELHVDLARAEACAWLARLGGDVTVEDGVAFDAWLEAAIAVGMYPIIAIVLTRAHQTIADPDHA